MNDTESTHAHRQRNEKFESLIRKINWYPPFLGMGIRVRSHAPDFTRFEVELRSRWYNRNLFGTHFGGSLYTMCDPFYVFIITMNLGNNFIVWDKSAAIRYRRPARGDIVGIFEILPSRLNEIRSEAIERGRLSCHFEAELKDRTNETVAIVTKEVHVRVKDAMATPGR